MPKLPDLPDDSLRELFAAVGRDAEVKFRETREELEKLITENDAVQILASLAHLFVVVKTPGRPPRDDRNEIEQNHLELAQALALTRPFAQDPPPGRMSDRVQQVIDLLLANVEASLLRRYAAISTSPRRERKKAFLLEMVRAHTQTIRGTFYIEQGYRYMRLVLDRIEGPFLSQYGVTGSTLLTVLQALIEVIESRLNELSARQARFFRKRKPGDVAREFIREFPEFAVNEAEVLKGFSETGNPPDRLRYALVEFTCLKLPGCFTLSREDVASVCPAGSDVISIERVISEWSLSFGDLADANRDHLYLNNPVWQRPFIRLEDGRLFWPIPNISLTFGFEMFELLTDPHKALAIAYHDARAEMLEEELGTLLSRHFPAGRVLRGLKWTDAADSVAYENDIAVVIDRTILIFEAKSRRVSPSALRSSRDRLSVEIEKLMVEPAEQSRRLMNKLSTERQVHRFDFNDGLVEIDVSVSSWPLRRRE